jgi:hypothetical protein
MIDVDAANAAIEELSRTITVEHSGDELETAGRFAFQYGALGDFLDEPYLSGTQSWPGPPDAALALLAHWSVQRGDSSWVKRDFLAHAGDCESCRWLEGCRNARAVFDDRPCDECGGQVDAHAVDPNSEGPDLTVVCVGQWQRAEPDVTDGGPDVFENQVSPTCSLTTWWAALADGNFALVTRTYAVVGGNDGPVLVRDDEYAVCPEVDTGTAIEITGDNDDLGSDNPLGEDLHQLAVDSFPPEPGEWQRNGPDWSAHFAVPVHV